MVRLSALCFSLGLPNALRFMRKHRGFLPIVPSSTSLSFVSTTGKFECSHVMRMSRITPTFSTGLKNTTLSLIMQRAVRLATNRELVQHSQSPNHRRLHGRLFFHSLVVSWNRFQFILKEVDTLFEMDMDMIKITIKETPNDSSCHESQHERQHFVTTQRLVMLTQGRLNCRTKQCCLKLTELLVSCTFK